MDNLDNQTEESLGWAAEGKKLAVDIPEVSFKDAATFVASMTPIIGDAVAAKEVYDELQKDEPNYYLAGALGGAALVGLVPGLGDVAAKAIKKGAKEVFDVASNIPKVSRKSTPSYTDAELLEADEIISEWGKGNLNNPELRSKLSDKGFTIETKRISPKMTGDDLEVVGPDGNIVRWKDMPRGRVDKEADAARTKEGKARLFNEGGAVMDEQMEMAFAEGERVDPVSGNEVPTGSLPEEVRDDIPAQLSEGEYVVPADVVRYYGVKFFEDLRSEAKTGFNQMQANGRIGGEPMGMEVVDPQDNLDIMFDDADFEVTDGPDGYAEGGIVTPTDFGIYVPETMEMREYVNAEGNTITIMFFNGMPMSAIPEGYTYVNPEPDPATTGGAVTTAADVPNSSDDGPPIVPSSTVEPTNYKELTPSELQALVEEQRSMTQDVIAGIGAVVNPILGLAMKVGMWHTSRQVTKELERRIADPESVDLKDKYAELLEYHKSDTDSYYDRIMDTIEGKERDKLPFDIDAADPAAINAAIEEGLLAEEGYSPDNIDEMPTGMDPIAAPEPIELTSLNDEPGARDYKGPLAGLSSMLDKKGGLPEPYVFNPETPAVSDNAAAFYASEDKVIADQRREIIKERMAEKQAERQRKLDALQAQIDAKDKGGDNDSHTSMMRAAQASAKAKAASQPKETRVAKASAAVKEREEAERFDPRNMNKGGLMKKK